MCLQGAEKHTVRRCQYDEQLGRIATSELCADSFLLFPSFVILFRSTSINILTSRIHENVRFLTKDHLDGKRPVASPVVHQKAERTTSALLCKLTLLTLKGFGIGCIWFTTQNQVCSSPNSWVWIESSPEHPSMHVGVRCGRACILGALNLFNNRELLAANQITAMLARVLGSDCIVMKSVEVH